MTAAGHPLATAILVLYLLLVSLTWLHWLTVRMTPQALRPSYWILMGATAIIVLAGARILGLPAALPAVRQSRPPGIHGTAQPVHDLGGPGRVGSGSRRARRRAPGRERLRVLR
jgi:hypothetical protein